jgi:hypothetical protein
MIQDSVNQLWLAMVDGECYSCRDLANRLDSSVEKVERVLKFLVKYGFLRYVSRREGLFQRVSGVPPPQVTIELLLGLVPKSS